MIGDTGFDKQLKARMLMHDENTYIKIAAESAEKIKKANNKRKNKYRHEHRELCNARAAAWRLANPEKWEAAKKKSVENNKKRMERIKVEDPERYAQIKKERAEYIKNYRQQHREELNRKRRERFATDEKFRESLRANSRKNYRKHHPENKALPEWTAEERELAMKYITPPGRTPLAAAQRRYRIRKKNAA